MRKDFLRIFPLPINQNGASQKGKAVAVKLNKRGQYCHSANFKTVVQEACMQKNEHKIKPVAGQRPPYAKEY